MASDFPTEWNLDQLSKTVQTVLGFSDDTTKILHDQLAEFQSDAAVEERITSLFKEIYESKKIEFGKDFFSVLRSVYLNSIDMLWVEHLNTMQELRTGIGLRGYAQTDPLVAYTSEGYRLFQQLLATIDAQTMRTMFRVERVVPEQKLEASVNG